MESDDEAKVTSYEILYENEEEKRIEPSKNGKATSIFVNGDSYQGYYFNGKRHGKGIYTFKNGTQYSGMYKDGLRTVGILKYPDKSTFEGNFVNNKPHGHGIYTYSNGDIYSGTFRQGIKHGKGVYIYKESNTQLIATFINGQISDEAQWQYYDENKPFQASIKGLKDRNPKTSTINYINQ